MEGDIRVEGVDRRGKRTRNGKVRKIIATRQPSSTRGKKVRLMNFEEVND